MKGKLSKRLIDSLQPQAKPYRVFDETLNGFYLRVQPSGAMSFYCRYRNAAGRERNVRVGNLKNLTVQQARDIARQMLADAATGADPAEQKKKNRSHTLKTFIRDEYRPWCEANLKTGKKICTDIEVAFPDLLKRRLDELTAFDVERWRRKTLKAGRSKATVNRYVAYLAAMLSRARQWGFIEQSPLSGGTVKKYREDNARVRFLDDDELAALMRALDDREERIRAERDSHNRWLAARGHKQRVNLRECAYADHLKPMVALSLHTGMRRGEVFGLRWENVDFTRRLILIHSTTTKSGKPRHIPMNQTVLDTLTGWRDMTTDTGLVFRNPKSGRRFDNVNTSWRAVIKVSGLQNFTWHDMRHHCASMLVQSGVDLYVVKEVLGHASITMTERYAHLSPHQTAAAMATLDRKADAADNLLAFDAAGGTE